MQNMNCDFCEFCKQRKKNSVIICSNEKFKHDVFKNDFDLMPEKNFEINFQEDCKYYKERNKK